MRRWLIVLLFPALAACSAVLSPAASPTPAPAAGPAQVELDIFSGRPNPGWTLSAADAATFQNMAAALSPASEQAYPARLGYRAIIVSLPSAPGGKVVWRVWDHVAQRESGAASAYYVDPDQALQRWLLQSGQPHLDADLYSTVQAELATQP